MSEGEGWGRDLLMRLLDDIRNDIVAMRDGGSETDRIARDALGKIVEVERRLIVVENDSKAAALSLVEIKSLARGVGSAWGAVAGALLSLLTAWALKALGIT